jgi:Sec-independent protein translocase protein TatA
MKKLVFLISTEGKSREQIAKEAWDAVSKFKVKMKEAEEELKQKTEESKLETKNHDE